VTDIIGFQKVVSILSKNVDPSGMHHGLCNSAPVGNQWRSAQKSIVGCHYGHRFHAHTIMLC
jgi:hypothetical protein